VSEEKKIDDSGSALPLPMSGRIHDDQSFSIDWFEGLSIRDYFAAASLQGLLAGYYSDKCSANLSEVPDEAFKVADAMIQARNSQ
jgi:hypothetical protein